MTAAPGRPLPGGAPDDGSADPRLAAALAAADGSAATRAEVLAALSGARVFVAVRAEATTVERTADGLRQESTAQMSLVCLQAPDGGLAVPVFSDGHEVQRWQPGVRPVPLPGPDACGAARDQGAVALLVDPAGVGFTVPADELGALADGWVPVAGSAGLQARRGPTALTAPDADVEPALVQALAQALQGEPVDAARLLQGPDGLVLGVSGPALGAADLAGLAARVLERARAALPPQGLDLAVVAADGPGLALPLARRGRLARFRGRRP